ncbi:MAG: hypothetical protein ACJA2M_003131 [Polaribacter sp.]|jgi:hypothetical protein
MKSIFKNIGLLLLGIILLLTLSYGFGWFGVGYKKTVGKALKNADREIFEETNSFTKAKRQEIITSYKEWKLCEDEQCKKGIENILSLSLADFNEDKFITDAKLLSWVKNVKY